MMVTLHEAASNTLDPSFLRNLRTFLDAAFGGDFTDADWAHAIGGFHIWLVGSAGVISHASLVERTIVCHGQAVRAGYVEAVATAPAFRGSGHGSTVMQRIGELVRERHELGALSTGI